MGRRQGSEGGSTEADGVVRRRCLQSSRSEERSTADLGTATPRRDLFCYRVLLWSYEKIFDLPVAFVSQYVSEQMRKEGNLRHEADNAMRTAEYLAKEPTLRDRVRVPKVYDEWTGESVMTAE